MEKEAIKKVTLKMCVEELEAKQFKNLRLNLPASLNGLIDKLKDINIEAYRQGGADYRGKWKKGHKYLSKQEIILMMLLEGAASIQNKIKKIEKEIEEKQPPIK